MSNRKTAFTLLELLVVIAIIAILAAVLFPVFARAKEASLRTTCVNNVKTAVIAMLLYTNENDDRLPDQRYRKSIGYRPWSTWPPSDPRSGWFLDIRDVYASEKNLRCPSVSASRMGALPQVRQSFGEGKDESNYWMWRFDRVDDPIPLDNFWGKTSFQAVIDLDASKNPTVGRVQSEADAELILDPYFPATIPSVPAELKGLSVHAGGRNRGFLDGHAKWLKDVRLRP